ncbi:arsenate-mycothiol transferase ArsC [Sinomicrobium soli]|uniref:arsenate-mycothiol transferase ArsC n=1 Tax=Sinomicrobium sp. N-1-3-6 TaxID=2219864 RepID=UPI000DCB577F|nr:protein-tyrosine-phosphatase [Sinomicrobium sp. N-1-3-6]RAV29319.1 protein-tyrosine-phosphatase [Sinomicrobium sp. N-1-3-6]
MAVYERLGETVETLKTATLSGERKQVLKPLVEFIREKVDAMAEVRLHFICTHNSRRSHLSQVWAQAMAHYFDIKNVVCYSGGTEATALYPAVAETLKAQGFLVQKLAGAGNAPYTFKFSENEHPVIGFSKKLDDDFNPKSEFAAVMTCDAAFEACPFVPGAEKRIPVTYEDPKVFDNTPLQAGKYAERSLQIAAELFYVFSQIQS